MLETLQNIDLKLFLFLNGLHSNFGDFFFYWFTLTVVWVPLFTFIIYLLYKQWGKQTIMICLVLALAILCNDQTCNILKRNIKRIRPSHDTELVDKVHLVKNPNGTFYRGGKFSFPSAHAANSCVIVFFFGFFMKTKKKWPLFLMILWSLLFAYSRIYIGVHYPFDILAGYVVGTLWSLLFLQLWKSSPKIRGEWIGKEYPADSGTKESIPTKTEE